MPSDINTPLLYRWNILQLFNNTIRDDQSLLNNIPINLDKYKKWKETHYRWTFAIYLFIPFCRLENFRLETYFENECREISEIIIQLSKWRDGTLYKKKIFSNIRHLTHLDLRTATISRQRSCPWNKISRTLTPEFIEIVDWMRSSPGFDNPNNREISDYWYKSVSFLRIVYYCTYLWII